MLKLNAGYSKKVPAESDYSSRSYHASVEVELPDGLSPEQLRNRIGETFALVRESVENEIHEGRNRQPERRQETRPPRVVNGGGKRNTDGASPRQLQYLQDLAASAGWELGAELRRLGVSRPEALSRQQCSSLIDEIRGGNARAA